MAEQNENRPGGPPPELTTIRLTVADGVAVALIDSPPVNVMSRELYRDLRVLPDHLESLGMGSDGVNPGSGDPEAPPGAIPRVLVLRSANPEFFIAHFDVELILRTPIDDPAQQPDELHGFHRMCERYRHLPIPVICEIDGRVGGGGGELSASCDMRFGGDRATLCQMEVPLGILPGGSGTQRLPGLVGHGRAMEIVLAGDDIDASTLDRWGWLNRHLSSAELSGYVDRLAGRLAGLPPSAVRRGKASVLAASPDPTPGLLTEAFLFAETLRFPAAQDRMRRFLALGGQTADGESRVGALGAELGPSPTGTDR